MRNESYTQKTKKNKNFSIISEIEKKELMFFLEKRKKRKKKGKFILFFCDLKEKSPKKTKYCKNNRKWSKFHVKIKISMKKIIEIDYYKIKIEQVVWN